MSAASEKCSVDEHFRQARWSINTEARRGTTDVRGLTTANQYVDESRPPRPGTPRCSASSRTSSGRSTGKAAYVEFRIGDYQHELGIIDRRFAPPEFDGRSGWRGHVLARRRRRGTRWSGWSSLGGKEYQGVTEHGPGFVTASVVDPFGNILGVMYNQHYLDILATRPEAK